MSNNAARNGSEIIADSVAKHIARDSKVYLNLGQDTIVITEDKVRLCLLSHLKKAESKYSWAAPLGILVAVILTLATSDFHDFFLKADVWLAIFVLLGVGALVWLICALRRARVAPTLDTIVAEMKPEGQRPPALAAAIARARPAVVGKPGVLEIVKAIYGTDAKSLDVTEHLRRKVSDNKLTITASNKIAGDPHRNVVKELRISYRYDGKDGLIVIPEEETASLPEQKAAG